jgi:hypothetical protein
VEFHDRIEEILLLSRNPVMQSLKKKVDSSERQNSLGRFAIIDDPELKFRVIAMVDYLSQVILKPIHSNLLKKLSNIPMDRTFTQDPFYN